MLDVINWTYERLYETEVLAASRKGLADDGRWLSPESRAQLHAWIARSPRVQALVEHRRRLAAVLETRGLFSELTVAEHLRLSGRARGEPDARALGGASLPLSERFLAGPGMGLRGS